MLRIHVLVRILFCFLFIFLPLSSMDEWFYDRFFRVRGYHDKNAPFALVRVNNTTLSQSAERERVHYPKDETPPQVKSHVVWNQEFYASLLEKIQAGKPQIIAFTSHFETVDNPQNAKLPKGKVLLSAILDEEFKLIPPPASLANSENYGYSNIFPDTDNVVRKAPLVYSSGFSLALTVYHHLRSERISRDLLEPLRIDYRGPAGSYPSYDARDILEGVIPADAFKNKIVLVGREISRYADYETPVGKMSKLELQANIMDTFLGDHEIHILPKWVNLILACFTVALSVIIILYFPLTVAWLFLILEAILVVLVLLISFSVWKVWTGVANPVFCIFATHLLMLGYKLSRQEEQQWKIQQETEKLKEMDQFKNNFIALFSHDLKTPIAKIKAIIDRLNTEHPSLPSSVQEALKGIDKTNMELARFISDILKVTKMESMQIEPTREVVDLNRLVEDAVGRLKFLADEKSIALVLDLEPLFSMEGDQQLLTEVITNLIENAIKYSPEGKKVIIRTSEEDNRVRVEVIDEGHGIPADELPRVTGKFYRGKHMASKVKGSGLGLYLSKYFVELHKGVLEIQSELNKGTTVRFWLPIAV